MPTFHNTRWPLLTALLESKGWVRAAEGTEADLSFVDDGAWQKEAASPYPGRMRFFSRAFTDLLSNIIQTASTVALAKYLVDSSNKQTDGIAHTDLDWPRSPSC